MTEPSAISGVLGLVLVFAIVAILGLLIEWLAERS